jgi:hypothetical protein
MRRCSGGRLSLTRRRMQMVRQRVLAYENHDARGQIRGGQPQKNFLLAFQV